jgi:hypothetical protein
MSGKDERADPDSGKELVCKRKAHYIKAKGHCMQVCGCGCLIKRAKTSDQAAWKKILVGPPQLWPV